MARPEIPERARLLVLGRGPELDRLKQLARDLGIGARVHFAGFRENVQDYLRLGSVYAFPSTLESFGLTLAQALCTGLPVVARRSNYPHVITSNESLIENGVNGYLTDTEAGMAEAIAALLADPVRRQAMGRAASDRAMRTFSWPAHCEAIDYGLQQIVRNQL